MQENLAIMGTTRIISITIIATFFFFNNYYLPPCQTSHTSYRVIPFLQMRTQRNKVGQDKLVYGSSRIFFFNCREKNNQTHISAKARCQEFLPHQLVGSKLFRCKYLDMTHLSSGGVLQVYLTPALLTSLGKLEQGLTEPCLSVCSIVGSRSSGWCDRRQTSQL